MCNTFVQFVIQRDSNDYFKFASLQSEFAINLLNDLGIPNDLSTVVLVEPNRDYYCQSTAILRIFSRLKMPYPALYYFIYIPECIRNPVYKTVASLRYTMFGKKDDNEACEYHPEWLHKFIT
eukprot:TRINITY_DN1734_c0_g1_i1.p1 TRINITY_DN1734_c0_g1~~TRINITY_DN1734_c0_g1_i1.p1  ORF type:complete len:122 (-),score=12.36 TRINITY_DN1734_c0_g1_i1:49-414(-)